MGPDLTALLDEMTKHLDAQDAKFVQHLQDHDLKLDRRLSDRDAKLDQRLVDLDSEWSHRFEDFTDGHSTRVAALEQAAASFEQWRPGVEGSVDALRLEVKNLTKHWDRAVMDSSSGSGLLGSAPSTAERPSARSTVDTVYGHRHEQQNRVNGSGVVTTLHPHPIKGGHSTLFVGNCSLVALGKVHDYIEQFSELMEKLSAYESQPDPIHYVTRFIDGLNDEIRPAVFVQHPVDLDTAFLIARLQEEVGEPMKKKDFQRYDRSSYTKSGKSGSYSSQFKQDPAPSPATESKLPPKSAEERWSALRAFRRAKGLCQFCAEKWVKGHKCANTIQLNVMQEMLELFPAPDEPHSDGSDTDHTTEQLFLTLSAAAVLGTSSSRTLCLPGVIQGIHMRILVDLGSSHTFISDRLAAQLSGICSRLSPLHVQVANDLMVLPLSAYDMILGLDWLDRHSPMQIHWQQKWMHIQYHVELVPQSDHLPAVQALLDEFVSLFAAPSGLPPQRDCDHTIPLIPGAAPVSIRPYRLTPALKNEVEAQVQDMLNSGIIQHSNTKGKYPVPVIDELLDELSGAPGTFLSAMNTTLGPYLRKFILVFFDDILIYSKSLAEHLHHLRLTFEILSRDHWFVKQSKCAFAQRSIAYLGHIVSNQAVSTDPAKIDAITHWPAPTIVKELRSFLGFAGYYRKFVRNFSLIAKPLFDLLKKGTLFIWTTAHTSSFEALKHALSQTPVLSLPDFTKPFCIEADASGVGIGAVLLQEGHPLAYISKPLGPKSLGLSTYEKEYLAILLAVQQWRHYLQHGEFIIFTDQKSLVQLTDKRLHTPWQQKVFSKLLGLQYRVIYKKGTDNRVADALSHQPVPPAQCSAISASVPSWITEIISLDFIEGLPVFGSANCILVVIDSFTKYGHFIALHHPFTAMTVAKSFIQNIYRLHGMPDQIVFDRDRIFTSHLWKYLFRLADVQLAMSSRYHPQSNGQTERLNQTLETFLRYFVSACPSKWPQWLALAEYWYNTNTHSATGFSPFEALYGSPPKHFGISSLDVLPDQAPLELSQWLQERRLMEQLVQQHLTRSKNRMKKQADKHRSERSFAVGDMVFVKLQPYVQSSLSVRSNQKLAFRFFGPFQILEKIGSVAYSLALPSYSSILPVFHVSQLKRAVLPPVQVSSSFPSDLDMPRFPEKILQHRKISSTDKLLEQVLVKWSNWPALMAMWEDRIQLQQAFPRAPAWGQAGSQDPRNVSTPAPPNVRGPSTRQKKPNSRVTGEEWISCLHASNGPRPM
ncbi:hypothetical protein U9M48_034647 [Paspalum notatum var. saurae]|uniref:Integrase catalytic domain-containing protein n=1 Tax=Paspalum notatum var. saurae TaxID=547442 RepID=A0AAQ3U9F8_PASNO